MEQNPYEPPPSRITPERAMFLATLPSVFCGLERAIGIYTFIDRVVAIPIPAAQEAMAFGVRAKLVEVDDNGRVRLNAALQEKRNTLESQAWCYEEAVCELANWIGCVHDPELEI